MFKPLFIIILFLLATNNFANAAIDSDISIKKTVSLVEYLIPDDENASIDIIKNLTFKATPPLFSLGSNLASAWLKITVTNHTQSPLPLALKNKFAYMANKIEVYEFLNNGEHLHQTYDLSEITEDTLLTSGSWIYEFNIAAKSNKTFYLKSSTTSVQLFDIRVSNIKAFFSEIESDHSFAYLICYFLLAIALYNLILYFLVKRLDYFFYSLYLTNSSIGLMYLYGLLSSNFGLQGANSQWLVLTSILVPFFLSLFIQSVFDTKTNSKLIHYSLHGVSAISIGIVLIAIFIDLPLAVDLNPLAFIVSFVVMLGVIAYFYKQNHPLIKLFFIAYLLYLIGIILTMLSLVVLSIPLNNFTFYGSGVGLLLECFLFSYLLYYRIQLLEKEVINQRNNIILQNKKNQMGDMIGAITHQWKQPLNAISSVVTMLQYKLDDRGEITKEELKQPFNTISDKVQFLSDTMNDFRYFFQPDGRSQSVQLDDIINRASSLLMDDFLSANVELKTDLNFNKPINTFQNELLHIILNILQNTLDAFKDSNSANRRLLINGSNTSNLWTIEFDDNAGGIDDDILPKIFDEYVTSKKEKAGSGIGLYLNRFILEKHLNGLISAKNIAHGSRFTISLKALKT